MEDAERRRSRSCDLRPETGKPRSRSLGWCRQCYKNVKKLQIVPLCAIKQSWQEIIYSSHLYDLYRAYMFNTRTIINKEYLWICMQYSIMLIDSKSFYAIFKKGLCTAREFPHKKMSTYFASWQLFLEHWHCQILKLCSPAEGETTSSSPCHRRHKPCPAVIGMPRWRHRGGYHSGM